MRFGVALSERFLKLAALWMHHYMPLAQALDVVSLSLRLSLPWSCSCTWTSLFGVRHHHGHFWVGIKCRAL